MVQQQLMETHSKPRGLRSAGTGANPPSSQRAYNRPSNSSLTANSTSDGIFHRRASGDSVLPLPSTPGASASASAISLEKERGGQQQQQQQQQQYPLGPSPFAATRGSVDATVDDHSSGRSQHVWPYPYSESDESSSDEARLGYRPLDHRAVGKGSGSRPKASKGFFRSIVRKFTKTSKRYGYFSDNEEERDRNVIQHQIIYDLYEGRLHLAPTRKPNRVLDVGTGPGLWALEFASQNPISSVTGIDIVDVKAPYTVPNCHFQIMDVTQEWQFENKFDFIHIRMLGDLPQKRKIVESVWDNLNPGGWVEFSEWIILLQSPNRSLDGTVLQRWNSLFRQGLRNLGSSLFYPNHYKPLLEKAGFERIHETKNGALTNPCYPGKRLRKMGAMMTDNWNMIIEPMSVPVLTNGLGWSEEQAKHLVQEARKEIADTRYHSFVTLVTVCAQKPHDGSCSSSSLHTDNYAASLAPSSSTSQSESTEYSNMRSSAHRSQH